MTRLNGGLRLALAFALGAGGAVAATYSTFETVDAHDKDVVRIEKTLAEIRQDVKELLKRSGEE